MLVEWSQLVLPSVFCAVAMRVDEPITVSVVNEVYRRTPKDLADKARWLGEFVQDVIERVPQLGPRAAYAKQAIRDTLIEHRHYIHEHGEDMPAIADWSWGGTAPLNGTASTESDNV